MLALIFVGLSVRVISYRVKTKVLLGFGDSPNLNVAIRTHANFSEYVPLALILLFGIENFGYSPTLVHIFGSILVFARLAHIHGVATNQSPGVGRPVGTILTLLVIGLSSLLILLKFFIV